MGLGHHPVHHLLQSLTKERKVLLPLEDGRLADLDDRRPCLLESQYLLPQLARQGQHQLAEAAVVLVGRQGSQGVGAGDQGLHRLRAVGGSEAIVLRCDRLSPLDSARDYRLAIVGVGIEVANEAVDGEAIHPAGEVGLVVLPADLTVADDVDTSLHLLLDHLDGDLVLHPPQLVLAYLPPLEARDGGPQPGRPGPIRYLGIAADDGSEHGPVLLLLRRRLRPLELLDSSTREYSWRRGNRQPVRNHKPTGGTNPQRNVNACAC